MFGDLHVMQIRKLQVILFTVQGVPVQLCSYSVRQEKSLTLSTGDVSACAHRFSSDPTLFNSVSQKSASRVVKCTLKYVVDSFITC